MNVLPILIKPIRLCSIESVLFHCYLTNNTYSTFVRSTTQLTQNVLTMLLPCSGNVITLTKHSSCIVGTFCVGWAATDAAMQPEKNSPVTVSLVVMSPLIPADQKAVGLTLCLPNQKAVWSDLEYDKGAIQITYYYYYYHPFKRTG